MGTKTENTIKKVEDLQPYALNPVIHSDWEIAQLAKLISRVGFINPIIIDENDMILAGHRRALACMKIGMIEVKCVQVFNLTHVEKMAYIIADNKTSENHKWDADLLRENAQAIVASEEFDTSSLEAIGIEIETDFDDQNNNSEFEYNEPQEKDPLDVKESKLTLLISFENEIDQQELFLELRDRGYKVKI